VVIAGDLFDGKWQDVRTGLWTAAQFRELDRAGIRVFLLQGNHDAASKVRSAISWPDNVHVFSAKKPETVLLEDLRIALHGQGFGQEKVTTDLAAGYPAAVDGFFNVGVLHTSLTGSPEHDTYAPTSLATLLSRGYDYWALGHIHARSDPPLHELPHIAYSGNLQGRHIRETGAKGALLATLDDGQLRSVEFVATDVLRWWRVDVTAQPEDGRDELLEAVRGHLERVGEKAGGRLAAIRLVVRGACRAHRQLVRESDRAELIAEIRNQASDVADDLWIEKVVLDTLPPVDLEALLNGKDLFGELLRMMRAARDDQEELDALSDCLKPLSGKASLEVKQAGIDLEDRQQVSRWLAQAEALLLARLMESEP